MKTHKLLTCAIAVASALFAAHCGAQNLPATLIDISPGQPVTGTLNNGAFVQNYPSGIMHFTTFDAFCVEPLQDLSYGESLVYQVQGLGLLPNSDKIARLVGGYLASSQSNEDAAAVNWAIWEITTESLSSPSLLDGNVRISIPVSQSTADLANQYLANMNTFTPANLVYLTNGTRQDVVSWNVVPEPGTLGLAAFSVVLLLRRRR